METGDEIKDGKIGVDVRCDKCQHFSHGDSTCHRYPPFGLSPLDYRFLKTHPGMWCGEFKAAK